MLTEQAPRSNRKALPSILLRSIVAGVCGAVLGYFAFAWGIYFASYSDRLMPFYPVGALAGGAAAVSYSLLFVWSTDPAKRSTARPLLAAAIGTVVLWAAMSNPQLGMEVMSRSVAAAIWLGCSAFLFFLIARRSHSINRTKH
jgi:H+/Cl- antiporter ClcA